MNNSIKEYIHEDCVLPELPKSFIHSPPKGYSYETEPFKRGYVSIYLRHHQSYTYNGYSPVRTIWGFYNTKTQTYHSPINAKTIGEEVRIEDTRPYTSMPLNLNPLMQCLMSPS